MTERVRELQKKEVINLSDGNRLGFVYDAQVNLESGRLENLIVPSRSSIFRLFWKYDEIIIDFHQIKKIGDDIILVELE